MKKAELIETIENLTLLSVILKEHMNMNKSELIENIEILATKCEKLMEERDEARRQCCLALFGTGVWRQPRMDLPGGSWTPQLIAKELGWDCFKDEVP
jgi:hypothetical protein